MAVFRVERTTGYTVMSNHHLRNKELTLKAKGPSNSFLDQIHVSFPVILKKIFFLILQMYAIFDVVAFSSLYIADPKCHPVNTQSHFYSLLSSIHAQHSIIVFVEETIIKMKPTLNKRNMWRLK